MFAWHGMGQSAVEQSWKIISTVKINGPVGMFMFIQYTYTLVWPPWPKIDIEI